MSKLKYQDQIDLHSPDLSNFEETERESYHWAYQPINDLEKNFIPYNVRTNEDKNFKGWGLSFFDSIENIKLKRQKLRKSNPLIDKVMPNFICKGTIGRGFGLCNSPNRAGHFTLLEYEGEHLPGDFTIIETTV